MKKLISGLLFVCFLAVSAVDGSAQEMMKAKKMTDHTWHQVVMVKFKPGTMDKAMGIIKTHFEKAGIESGVPGPQMLMFKTGEWDMMFVWKMKNISDLEWEISPDDEKWWKEMVNQVGSEEKAMKIWQDYMGLVDRSTTYLATAQAPMEGETMGSTDN